MKEKYKTEVSAGGIVYKKTKDGIFIAFILGPHNKWTFAKGHVEKGEKSEDAAIRETEEEMGTSGLEIIDYLGKIDLWFKEKGSRVNKGFKNPVTIHKFIYYFLMKAPEDVKTSPQKYEKIQEIKWMPIDKALEFSSYKDVEEVLKKAISILKNSKHEIRNSKQYQNSK